MDAVEFIKQVRRMGKAKGEAICFKSEETETEIVERIEKWAKEHPVKTRQSEFLKLFPEASVLGGGYLNICPAQLSSECRDKKTGGCYDPGMDCGKCKRDFWLKEVE